MQLKTKLRVILWVVAAIGLLLISYFLIERIQDERAQLTTPLVKPTTAKLDARALPRNAPVEMVHEFVELDMACRGSRLAEPAALNKCMRRDALRSQLADAGFRMYAPYVFVSFVQAQRMDELVARIDADRTSADRYPAVGDVVKQLRSSMDDDQVLALWETNRADYQLWYPRGWAVASEAVQIIGHDYSQQKANTRSLDCSTWNQKTPCKTSPTRHAMPA